MQIVRLFMNEIKNVKVKCLLNTDINLRDPGLLGEEATSLKCMAERSVLQVVACDRPPGRCKYLDQCRLRVRTKSRLVV